MTEQRNDDRAMQPGRQLLLVWHSVTGGAKAMAEAIGRGVARVEGVTGRLVAAEEAQAEDVLSADALVWICPEMLGSMSGVMKAFFDRCYYPVLGTSALAGRPYAVAVCAGSDGQGAVRQLQRLSTGWRLKEVLPPVVVCVNAQTPESIARPKVLQATDMARCEELGEALASGVLMGVF